MSNTLSLKELDIGETARVLRLDNVSAMKKRLLGIGLVEGTMVECVGRSPALDPSAYLIRGAVIAIRAEDAALVRLIRGGEA